MGEMDTSALRHVRSGRDTNRSHKRSTLSPWQNDVGMPEPRCGQSLGVKPRQLLFIGVEARANLLECDEASQRALACLENDSHATAADRL